MCMRMYAHTYMRKVSCVRVCESMCFVNIHVYCSTIICS